MKPKLTIVSGSYHTIPPTKNSPGVPRILYRFSEELKNEFDLHVISADLGEKSEHEFDKNIYHQIKRTWKYRAQEVVLKLFPFKLKKKIFGLASPRFINYYRHI